MSTIRTKVRIEEDGTALLHIFIGDNLLREIARQALDGTKEPQ